MRDAVGPGDQPGGQRPVSILLVDDVKSLVELQKSYLKRTTCRILTARTGAQALSLCRQDRPDLVFLESTMPEMDGVTACRLIKGDAALRDIPVVIIASEDRLAECRQAGCDDVLVKPFEATTFLGIVRRFVPLLERLEGRIPVSCRVEFKSRSGSYTAYTRDLSARGLFLKSPRPFVPGTRLSMSIHLPLRRVGAPDVKPSPLEVEGEVRRVIRREPGSHLLEGVGVRFVDPPPEVLRAIEEFIAARRRQ